MVECCSKSRCVAYELMPSCAGLLYMSHGLGQVICASGLYDGAVHG
jgi:hypothetical protein